MSKPIVATHLKAELQTDGWHFAEGAYRSEEALLALYCGPTDPDNHPGFWIYYKGGKLTFEPMNKNPIPLAVLEPLLIAIRGVDS
jgi:hypothetical protein